MAIEDPDLVAPSRKAARRRLHGDNIMRALSKMNRISARMEELGQTQARRARQIARMLARATPTRAH